MYILTADQDGNPSYYEMDPRVKTVDYAIGYIGADQLGILQKAMKLPGFLIRHYVRMKRTLMEIRPDIVVSMYGKEIFFLPLSRMEVLRSWRHMVPAILGPSPERGS